MRPKSATERIAPATKKEIAVELEKLRAVFGYEAGAWETAAPLYLDALSDLPPDLLSQAVATCIRMAHKGDYFPRPGQIRELVAESLELRRYQARRESKAEDSEEEWPRWLSAIWGPLPQGRIARNQAAAEHERREIESRERLAEISRLMRERGLTCGQAWLAWLGQDPGSPGGFSMQQVRDALGVTATERKAPKHEDPAELRKAAAELGIFNGEESDG